MSDGEHIFRGKVEDIRQMDFEAYQADLVAETQLDYYPIVTGQFWRKARDSNDTEGETVFGFIQTILGPLPNFHSSSEPFRPMAQGPDSRSFLPDDLSASDVEALEALGESIEECVLKSRVLDFLFLRTANYKLAGEASSAYRVAAAQFNRHDSWTDATVCFQRALQLSAKLGRDKPLILGIVEDLTECILNRAKEEKGFACYRYMKTLLAFGTGDSKRFAELSRELAERATENKEHRLAQHYFQVEAEWHRLGKNAEKAEEADLLGAESLVADSEHDVAVRKNHQAASHKLTRAIEMMIRNGTAGNERIAELKAILRNNQKETLDGFTKIHEDVDVTEAAKEAMGIVSGVDLIKALERLAFMWDLVDLEQLREDTLAETKKSLREFFSGQQLDDDGKPVRNILSLPSPDAPDYEEILEQKMFEFAGKCHWNYGVTAVIEPARRKIEEEHHPMLHELEELILNNPFVPPGHELIFLRGLHSGLCGDFLMSCHLLVPQIENSVRYVLEQNGVDIINMKGKGLQEAKTLGTLLQLPAAIGTFGEPLCFELRGALTEKASHDLRNRLAHGFVTHRECEGISGRHIWWLVLRMCLALHLNNKHRANSEIIEGGEGSNRHR